MSYTLFTKTGKVVRDSDKFVVFPCTYPTAEALEYEAWLKMGNQPTLDNTDEMQLVAANLFEQLAPKLEEVNKLTIQYHDRTFTAAESCQARMARAILTLDDVKTVPWRCVEGEVVYLNKQELTELLSMAMEKTMEILSSETP